MDLNAFCRDRLNRIFSSKESPSAGEYALVQTTIDELEAAERIAEALVGEKLAACVQISAVQSRFVWKGELARENEFLLSAKARFADFDAVTAAIKALHSYELPEIVAIPIIAGEATYLEWLWRETDKSKLSTGGF